eukprot:6211332-Pleurochrysis_carterae.AAC.3
MSGCLLLEQCRQPLCGKAQHEKERLEPDKAGRGGALRSDCHKHESSYYSGVPTPCGRVNSPGPMPFLPKLHTNVPSSHRRPSANAAAANARQFEIPTYDAKPANVQATSEHACLRDLGAHLRLNTMVASSTRHVYRVTLPVQRMSTRDAICSTVQHMAAEERVLSLLKAWTTT